MPVRKFDFVSTFFHKIIAEQIFRYKVLNLYIKDHEFRVTKQAQTDRDEVPQ